MKYLNYISRNPALLITLTSLLLLSLSTDYPVKDNKIQTVASPAFYSSKSSQPDTTRERKDAPDFTLDDIDGDPFTLSEQEGKVVVLNIWATWCGPCRKEIPDFIKIQDEMREDGVLFVGVSLDEEGWEVVRPFAEEYEINYPLVVDDGSVFDGYGPFRGIPMTYIIDREGKIEYVAPGLMDIKMLKSKLERLVPS